MQLADTIRAVVTAAVRAGVRAYDVVAPGEDRLGAPQPAPAGADPVVLVGGFGTDTRFLETWRRSLAADGYRAFAFDDPAHGMGPVREAARGLAATVEQVLRTTGARRVDLVTYSAGCAVARAWLSLDRGAASVDRLVCVDGSWRGDDDSRLLGAIARIPGASRVLPDAIPPAFLDLQRTSALYADLAARPELPRGVRVAAIYPIAAAAADRITGAVNVPLRDGVGHAAVLRRSRDAYEAARALLRA